MQRMGYFENGGFIPGSSGEDNKELLNALNLLNARLSEPIKSYTVYGDYELKAKKAEGIRNAGIIR